MVHLYHNFALLLQYYAYFINIIWGCRGRDSMVVGFTTTCAISDLQSVGGFLQALRFPPLIKLIATI